MLTHFFALFLLVNGYVTLSHDKKIMEVGIMYRRM